MRKLTTSMHTLTLGRATAGLLTLAISGCGGGGGGGGDAFVGAATISIELTPSRIDSGDRTLVTTYVGDVHKNGIALKYRFPEGLIYVPDSASLEVDDKKTSLPPTNNVFVSKENSNYLVFYLSQSLFRTQGEEYNGGVGKVTLQLEGRAVVRDGEVEIDADVDDPLEDNSAEFSTENPEFSAEDSAGIQVVEN